MGILRRLAPVASEVARREATAELAPLPAYSSSEDQVAALSPAVAQAFGINTTTDTVTRAQAMSIPAVRRGRQVICGPIGNAPLVATRRVADRPPERVARKLLDQPDPNTSRQHTITWTVDDLLFYGVSWWRVLEREAGFPARAERVAPHRIAVDLAAGTVRVDGRPVADRDLIRFDGPDEGILTHGARSLRTYLLLEEAVRKFARLDVPLGYLQDELGQMEAAEVQDLLDGWEAARQARTTGYIPHGLTYEVPGFNADQLQLGEAREFQSAEIARLLNLPAAAVNAPSNDSLTYSTTENARRELVDSTLGPFNGSLELRLSMGDVTPTGTTVTFDLTRFMRGDSTTQMENAVKAVTAKLMTVDEARDRFLDLPPMAGDAPAEDTEEDPAP